jgi:hypothetical protein
LNRTYEKQQSSSTPKKKNIEEEEEDIHDETMTQEDYRM